MNDRFHIAVRTVGALEPARAKQLADALSISTYDVRIRLKTPMPRSLSIFASQAEVEQAANAIRGDDLIVITYREAQLPPQQPFAAFRMGRTQTGFIFEDRRKQRIKLTFDEIGMLVIGYRGDINEKTELQARPPTYITHGARTGYKVDVKTTRQRDVTMFAAFFPMKPDQTPVHVVADHFDFSCLGKQKGSSDMINQRKLCEIIERALTETPIDRRLLEHRVYPDMVPHNRRACPDAAFAAAQMIYWEQVARQQSGYLNACAMSAKTH